MEQTSIHWRSSVCCLLLLSSYIGAVNAAVRGEAADTILDNPWFLASMSISLIYCAALIVIGIVYMVREHKGII